jgi:hypothetical protein
MGRLWAAKQGRPDRRHPSQGGQDLPGGCGQQPGDLALGGGDVGLQALVAGQVTAQPLGAQLRIWGGASSRRQRSTQNRAVVW